MADVDPDKTKTIHITLTARARSVVDKLRDDTGIPNTEAVARLLEWFASLDRKYRLALLNRDESTRAELARLTLEQMAKGVKTFGEVGDAGTARKPSPSRERDSKPARNNAG